MSRKKPKVLRKHIKHTKRMAKLMYQKGLLDPFLDDDIHWDNYRSFNNKKLPNKLYYYDLYFWYVDYWGEGDQIDLMDRAVDVHLVEFHDDYEDYYNAVKTLNVDIKYLKSLPTTRTDKGYRKFIKVKLYD